MESTETERIDVLIMRGCGDLQRSYREVVDLFNVRRQKRISKSTVYTTARRLEENGSVRNHLRSGRPKSTSDEMANGCAVCNVLRRNSYHLYKVHLMDELSEDDFDPRIEYCITMMEKLDLDSNFVKNIVFSAEANFVK